MHRPRILRRFLAAVLLAIMLATTAGANYQFPQLMLLVTWAPRDLQVTLEFPEIQQADGPVAIEPRVSQKA